MYWWFALVGRGIPIWKTHYLRGALVDSVSAQFQINDDATLAAVILYRAAQSDLPSFLSQSFACSTAGSTQRDSVDIDYCLQLDQYDIVPQLHESHLIVP